MKNKNFFLQKFFPIAIIVITAFFFRLYNLENRYTFEWDQEDDAIKVMEMINLHKPRLIGPRVANDNSFFVGPYHYYFLVPFYLLTRGDPIAGAYAAITIGVLTCLVAYFVISAIFSWPSGLIVALLFAITPGLISWNAMYAALFSLLIFYFCYRSLVNQSSRYYPLIYFLLGLAAATHLVPICLIVPVIFTTIFFSKKPKVKILFFSVFLFILPFIPILIFDFRHNFLNIRKIFEFATNKNSPANYFPLLFLRTFWRSLSFFNVIPILWLERSLSLLILILGPILLLKGLPRILAFVWIFSPLLLLSFYRGSISEYYYSSVIIFIPVFLGVFLSKTKLILIPTAIILLLIFLKFKTISSNQIGATLKTKKNIVGYFITQKRDQLYNISYDLPNGWQTGYGYLFQYFGQFPQNTETAHLYTIFLLASPTPSGELVYKDGILGIVRR